MTAEGVFPKIAGDQLYTSEYNNFFGVYSDCITYNLPVTTSTDNIDLSAISYKYSMLIRNIGTTDCYFDLASTATTSSMYLPAGYELTLTDCSFSYISAITSAGTTTLSVAVFIGCNSKIGYRTNSEVLSISATDTSSNLSFTSTTTYKDIIITNVGNNEVYIKFNSTATTSDFRLEPKESLILNTNKYQIAAICNTGETATVRILGVY